MMSNLQDWTLSPFLYKVFNAIASHFIRGPNANRPLIGRSLRHDACRPRQRGHCPVAAVLSLVCAAGDHNGQRYHSNTNVHILYNIYINTL